MSLDPETAEALKSFKAALSVIQEKNPGVLCEKPRHYWSTSWASWSNITWQLGALEDSGWEIFGVYPIDEQGRTVYKILARKEHYGPKATRRADDEEIEGNRAGPQCLVEQSGPVPSVQTGIDVGSDP